jgi:hypothetical protein
MSYWINHNLSYLPAKQIAFECDDESDISTLPTETTPGVQQGDDTTSCQPVKRGSSCLCIGTSDYYKLNSLNQWKPI